MTYVIPEGILGALNVELEYVFFMAIIGKTKRAKLSIIVKRHKDISVFKVIQHVILAQKILDSYPLNVSKSACDKHKAPRYVWF